MPKMLIYGEDGLTLKYTKERLGEILQQVGDDSNPSDCTIFFRPSFGRGKTGYGEFDAIIVAKNKAYLVEAKWDGGRNLTGPRTMMPITLKENQIRRHEIFHWFSHNWNGETGDEWDQFAHKNNPEFEEKFSFMVRGEKVWKSIYPSDTLVGENTQTMLKEIGDRKLENVILVFYSDVRPKVEVDFKRVFIKYDQSLGLFTELE